MRNEPTSRQPEKTGASPGELAAIPASFKIVCPREDLRSALQLRINNSKALGAALKAGNDEIKTIKLTPVRSGPLTIHVRADELLIDYLDRTREVSEIATGVEKLIFRRAIVETSISALQQFIHQKTLLGSDQSQVTLFLQAYTGTSISSPRELRPVVRDLVDADIERLNRKQEQLLKKLRKCSLSSVNSWELAESKISTLREMSHQALAIIKLRELASSRTPQKSWDSLNEDVLRQIELSIKELALSISNLWSSALVSGDRAAAEAVISLRQKLQTQLRADGFNIAAPDPFSPEPKLPRSPLDILSRTLPPLHLDLGTFHTQSSPLPRFNPEVLRETDSFTRHAQATLEYDQRLRSWTTSDPDPFGFLRERLLDIIPHVPAALRDLRDSFPEQLPTHLTEFIDCVCLLRFNGGHDGLAHFASLACHLTSQELKTVHDIRSELTSATSAGEADRAREVSEKLNTYMSSLPSSHPLDYVELIEFVATWPLLRSREERVAECELALGRITALSISVLYTITKGLEDSFCHALKEGTPFGLPVLHQFQNDLAGLSSAAVVLGNQQLSRFVEPTTSALLDLITALEVRALPMPGRLSRLTRVEEVATRCQERLLRATASGETPANEDSALFLVSRHVDVLLEELRAALDTYMTALPGRFGDIDTRGSTQELVALMREALEVLSGCSDAEVRHAISTQVDSAALSWTNIIGDSLATGVAACKQQLNQTSDWFKVLSDFLPLMEWHALEAQQLSQLFRTTPTQNSAVRVNHVNHMLETAREGLAQYLVSNPGAFRTFLNRLQATSRNTQSKDLEAMARQILSLPIAPGRLPDRGLRESYEGLKSRAHQA